MLEDIVDEVAERIRSLGEYAPGNLKFLPRGLPY